MLTFTFVSGSWRAEADVNFRLAKTANGWSLVTDRDETETYDTNGRLISFANRAGLKQNFAYDGQGRLISATDPFGRALTFFYVSPSVPLIAQVRTPDGLFAYAYDANKRLISVTYPDSTKRQYVYENPAYPNFLTGVIDENGNRFATWSYDATGRATTSQHAGGVDQFTVNYTFVSLGVASVTNPLGSKTNYLLQGINGSAKHAQETRSCPNCNVAFGTVASAYDANGNLTSQTDFNGNLAAYSYDLTRNLETSRTMASGSPVARTITTVWHPTFRLPVQITEPNRTTVFSYDAHGNLLTVTITANAATRNFSYTYNASGQVLTATDPRGNVTSFAYDGRGNLTSVTDALGHVRSIPNYDSSGRPLTILDPNGVTTALTYDRRSRLTSRTVGQLRTAYAYDRAGNLIRVTLPDRSYLAYSYDQAHRLTGIADAAGDHIAYTLDVADNKITAQAFDPSGMLTRTRSYAYDDINRLSSEIGSQRQTISYTYDNDSNPASVTDPLGHTTTYAYDALNRLAQAIDPNGGTTSYGYNANDHLASVTDPRGLNTAYSWDGLDDPLQLASPDTGTTNRTFDAAGNVVSSTNARGQTTTYSYDALNRRMQALFADGTSAVWQYDQGDNGIGRLSKLTDVTGSTSYRYDANGHVTKKRQIVGAVTLTTVYDYDEGGRLARVTYPSGRHVLYVYDAAGRISGVTANDQTLVAGVTYLPFGMATGWTAGNGASYQRMIDKDGQIVGLTLPASGNVALAYDAASRISGIAENGLPAKTFAYEALSRLTGYASGAATQAYTYDADGNRTGFSSNDGITTPVSLTYNYDTASNHMLGIGGSLVESFTYDASGNTLSYSAPFADYSFSYDARNRLTQSFVGAIGTSYLINGLGQRVFAAGAPQFTFAYDEAGHLIGKYSASANRQQETVWLGDLPVAVMAGHNAGQGEDDDHAEDDGSAVHYIAPDHLGAPHQITDASGQVVWLWDHDPFGNGAPSGTFSYDLRFPGQFFDQNTKLHYNYFRDYDPRTGRYIESDPIGLTGGINTYGYVGGNPVSFSDPYGVYFGWDDLLFSGGGAIVGVAGQGFSDLISGQLSGWEDYAGSAIGGAAGGEALLYTGPIGAGAIGGLTTNLAKQGLKNLTGTQCGFDAVTAIGDTAIGAATGLIPGVRIPGITAGQGSMNSIYKQIVTKATNGTISSITPTTAVKMFVGSAVDTSLVPGAGAAAVAGIGEGAILGASNTACSCK